MGILLSQDLPSEREALDAYSTVVASVAERLAPSVASLRVTQRRGHRGLELAGSGSAVVITGDGYLLTSAHVVARADAGSANGRTFSFDVVGTDPLSDLAGSARTTATPRSSATRTGCGSASRLPGRPHNV